MTLYSTRAIANDLTSELALDAARLRGNHFTFITLFFLVSKKLVSLGNLGEHRRRSISCIEYADQFQHNWIV